MLSDRKCRQPCRETKIAFNDWSIETIFYLVAVGSNEERTENVRDKIKSEMEVDSMIEKSGLKKRFSTIDNAYS